MLHERFSLVDKLTKFKTHVTDKKRENFILQRIKSPLVKKVYKAIFRNSKILLRQKIKV